MGDDRKRLEQWAVKRALDKASYELDHNSEYKYMTVEQKNQKLAEVAGKFIPGCVEQAEREGRRYVPQPGYEEAGHDMETYKQAYLAAVTKTEAEGTYDRQRDEADFDKRYKVSAEAERIFVQMKNGANVTVEHTIIEQKIVRVDKP